MPSTMVVDDVPAGSFAMIALTADGAATHAGTIDYAGDSDLFAFVSSVTGQANIKVDGGVIPEQNIAVLVAAGQTYAFSVFADGAAIGAYQITITSIADDFPDATVNTIVLNPDGSGAQVGTIDYASDVDVFRFTAPVSGIITLSMTTSRSSGLISSLTAPRAPLVSNFTPSPGYTPGLVTSDEIIQFQVLAGRQYLIRAAGDAGSDGDYTLTFDMATDDFSATVPTAIALDQVPPAPPPGPFAASLARGSLMGGIEVPGDVDLFEFTAETTGFALIQLDGVAGTDFHGMLTTSVPFVPFDPATGFVGPSLFGGTQSFLNAAGQATLTTEWKGNTLDPYVVIPIVEGEMYRVAVSGDGILEGKSTDPTIGKYVLMIDLYATNAFGFVDVDRDAFHEQFAVDYHSFVFFTGTSDAPSFGLNSRSVAPVLGGDPPLPPTDARLTVAALPSAATLPSPSAPTAPSLDLPLLTAGGNILASPASGSSQAASSAGGNQAASSLVTSLLSVAARDNSTANLPGTALPNSALAAQVAGTGPALQRDFAAPGGSEDGRTITGTVFNDVNGDGIQQPGELGLAGETVTLEGVRDGKAVVLTAATDAAGRYRFANLDPGEYQLSLARKADPSDALASARPISVRIALPTNTPVVNIGKRGSIGAWLNLEPLDLSAVLSPLFDAICETTSPEVAPGDARGSCLFFIALGASQFWGQRELVRVANRSARTGFRRARHR